MVRYRDDEEDPAAGILRAEDDPDNVPGSPELHIRSTPDSPTTGTLPIPIWLRESASSFRYKWVPLPVRKAGRAIVTWVKGPQPPRVLRIEPIFPKIQQAPIRLLDKYAPKKKQRVILLMALYVCWFLTWSLMVKQHSTSGFIKGYGRPTNLWCGASFWNEGNGCGLNGNMCRPFSAAHLTFRCPANCEGTHLLEEHMVGNKSLRYQGLVVGGPDPQDPESMAVYRADSFICQAAIHAGITTDANGGCGVATLVGSHTNFASTKANGIESTSFPGTFPRSFTFQHLSSTQAQCPKDSRWPLFVVTAVALVILSLFTTSPAVFFFSTFVIMFLHVGLVSDPPNTANVYEAISKLVERILPASFIAIILYRVAAVPLLTGVTAQIEKTILYLGFCFIGALNNYTFAPLIPIERLTPHDLAQPGAPFALAIIVTVILAIVISQVHFIRISGNMPKYLAIYGAMVVTLGILLALPNLRLRIHHYILAMLFMPGTFTQIRPCLGYQGLLLGLFINGVARWGFASIIQTPAALGEANGGGSNGSPGSWWGAKSPNVTAVVAPDISNITFNWGPLPRDSGVDGVSILINDVERWRGYTDEELYWDSEGVTLKRRHERGDSADGLEPEFFRFAWMSGSQTGLYSKVGLWDEHGRWRSPEEGTTLGSSEQSEVKNWNGEFDDITEEEEGTDPDGRVIEL
ncbi:LCCL domain containing protein [Cladophialophora carrionii]|uniref:LCCL domain containing protein n=1 Tax=Cladophialophora carrionii TaxID=86049 RepID=A0A1C1CW63_9EURO|nr:LCCL domain containing protein [Cladophialophora carrionii]